MSPQGLEKAYIDFSNIKKSRDLDYYFCIFERSYVVPHSTLGLNNKPTKDDVKTSQFTLEILLSYQISLIPFKMTLLHVNNINCKREILT